MALQPTARRPIDLDYMRERAEDVRPALNTRKDGKRRLRAAARDREHEPAEHPLVKLMEESVVGRLHPGIERSPLIVIELAPERLEKLCVTGEEAVGLARPDCCRPHRANGHVRGVQTLRALNELAKRP